MKRTTRVFQKGDSQVMIIPEELRTERTDYCINKIGEVFIAFPADDPWAPARQVIGAFPSDYMNEREQPAWNDLAEREEL